MTSEQIENPAYSYMTSEQIENPAYSYMTSEQIESPAYTRTGIRVEPHPRTTLKHLSIAKRR